MLINYKMQQKEENNVKVCLYSESCCSSQEGRSIQHVEPRVYQESLLEKLPLMPFPADNVFDEGATNQEVFHRMAQCIICTSMLGFNGTILTYGQTLSGKKYTMMDDSQNPSVMVLAAKIFQKIAKETNPDFLLRASYIDIFNKKINDLLNKRNQELKIQEAGNGIVRVDCVECAINCEDDLMRLICKGRTVGNAHRPERSGHSHAILRILSCLTEIFRLLQHYNLDAKQIIETWRSDRSGDLLHSILNLVDLPGSERLIGDSPTRVTDSVRINKSLMFLSNVINHLSDNNLGKNTYISLRDLQASLSGNCFTSITCTIRPTIIEDSQSTLNFAVRARKIRINPPVNNMEHQATAMIKRVDSEIKKLRDQLATEKRKKDNKLKVQILESKLIAEKLKIISSQPLDAIRRWKTFKSVKPEAPRAGLPRPNFDFDFLSGPQRHLAHNNKSTDTNDLPTVMIAPSMYQQSILKCANLQAEVSALTALLKAKIKSYEEQVKSLNETIARLEMENHLAVDLKHQLDCHKAQAQQLEIHLLTSINGRDSTIEELHRSLNNLSRDVLRIETMQAEYQVIQQKYNKLQDEYESLERTSNASEEECQKLQADNTRLELEIGTLKERVEETQRKLMEAPSQEIVAEDFKVKMECQSTELVAYQEGFEGFQDIYELSETVKENNVLRLVSSQRQNAFLIAQLQDSNSKLTESLKQAEARQEQTISSSEYEKQIEELRESLREAKDELKLREKQKSDDELEYVVKLEKSENENRAKILELQESKDQYERQVAKLKKQYSGFEEELSRVTDRCQAEKSELWHEKNTLKEKLLEAAENQRQMDVAHTMELEKVRTGLQDQIRQTEDERNKALEELAKLRSSHDQLAIYTDNLREEKSILQFKIDEADAQHSVTLRKFHELEMQMEEDMSKQKEREESKFEENQDQRNKIAFLKEELQSARLKAVRFDELFSVHEDLKLSLSEATGVSSTLQEKVNSLQSQLLASKQDISSRDLEKEKLCSDLKLALEAKDTASAEQLALTTKLQVVEKNMVTQGGKYELADLNGFTNDLQLQLKSLHEREAELEAENDEFKVKLKNAENLRDQLEEEQKLSVCLRIQFAELEDTKTRLEETKTRLEEQLENKEAEINRKLLKKSLEVELARRSIEELTEEREKLRCDLETKTNSSLKEREGLESTLANLSKEKMQLEERIRNLNLIDNRNAEIVASLRAKEAETESLREATITQKFACEEANGKCRLLMEQKLGLTKEIEQLRATLKTKETSILTERENMNATITCLLDDKRNLEEKQCTLKDIVTKLEEELSALQAIKSNKCNSSNGPLASQISIKPLDPKQTACAGALKKSSIIESAVRRERRKTAHDEHRMQSYWNDFRDFGTMTEPEDCRPAAWNTELIKIKTRMLKEHEKTIIERRRLRRKIRDLTLRIRNPSEPQNR